VPGKVKKGVVTTLISAALMTGAARPAGEVGIHQKTAAAKVRHIFLIVLENKGFRNTFTISIQDPYLQHTLVPQGALLTQYYGTGRMGLASLIAMLSGQSATVDTDNDCLPYAKGLIGNYADVQQRGIAPQGQVVASGGCIYGKNVANLPGQLDRAGLGWRAYMEDMGNDPAREAKTCGHPDLGVGTDNTNLAEAPSVAVPPGDAYTTRRNPFVYFHSILDDAESCARHVVNLDLLPGDLAGERTTPNFVYIAPNLCNSGHDGVGTGQPGSTCANWDPGGLTSVDGFLKKWVPQITNSPAFQKDGLLIIIFVGGDSQERLSGNPITGKRTAEIVFPGESCCNQQPGPNLAKARPATMTLLDTATLVQQITMDGYGGGRVGALLLSPFVKPGSSSDTPYNDYSLLRTIEDSFHLDHIGYAADDPQIGYFVKSIGDDTTIFNSGTGEVGATKGSELP
jgi:phosphatidylinositol-3-phosphatase